MSTSQELLHQYASTRDGEAFAAVAREHAGMVFSTCYRILGDASDAEDTAQECFWELARNAAKAPERVGAWLHGVATRKALFAARTRQRRKHHEAEARKQRAAGNGASTQETWVEISPILDKLIEDLPEELREPLVLYYLEGWSQKAIAAELGVSFQTVSRRVQKAAKILRAGLGKSGILVGAMTLTSLLASQSAEAAPVALTAAIGKIAATGAGTVAVGSAVGTTAVKTIVMGIAMKKAIAVAVIAVAVAAGGIAVQKTIGHKPAKEPAPQAQAPSTPETKQPMTLSAPQPQSEEKYLLVPEVFHLRLIHKTTKEPLSGASIEVQFDNQFEHLTTDDQGRCAIELAGRKMIYFSVLAKEEGMVPMRLTWRPGEARVEIPANYELALEPGTSIGGIIQDEQGKPIERATVFLLVPGGNNSIERVSIGDEFRVTDAEGRWRCDIMPAKLDDIWIRLEHPDYASDVMYGTTPKPPMEKLRDMTGVMVMKKGARVAGRVVDKEGMPIAGASVVQGRDRHGTQYPSTTTDEEGGFLFDKAQPGEMVITVQASGYAPELKIINAGKDTEPVEFVLSLGSTIWGQVVDAEGKPLANIPITADTWRRCRSISWHARTDAEGHFEWHDAPADAVLFDIYPRDYMSVRRFPMKPSNEKYVITMYRPLKISGRVTDAETQKPIEKFRLVRGIKWDNTRPVSWDRRRTPEFTHGRYDVTFTSPRYAHVIRIEASGYLPAISRDFKNDEGEQVCDFELKKGSNLKGVVKSADGSAVAEADIILVTPSQGAYFDNGRANNQQCSIIGASKSDGTFELPPQLDRYAVVVIHDSGYAQLSQEEFEKSPEIVLQPWAQVEGTLFIGAAPAEKGEVNLFFEHHYDPNALRINWGYRAPTDKGRFAFTRVPAGKAKVSRAIRSGSSTRFSHGIPLELMPGQTAKVKIGGTGRPVTGRFTLPADAPVRADWIHAQGAYITLLHGLPGIGTHKEEQARHKSVEERRAWIKAWNESPEGQAYRNAQRNYVMSIKPDGSFRAEDIPAGKYKLDVTLSGPPENTPGRRLPFGEPIASLSYEFTVPEMPGGRSDEPLDLGILELKLREKASNRRQQTSHAQVKKYAWIVKSPDGHPAVGADAVLVDRMKPVTLRNGKIDRKEGMVILKSDRNGVLQQYIADDIPANQYAVLVTHDSGYAQVSQEELEKDSEIVLQPWAQVEGTLFIGSAPAETGVVGLSCEHDYNPNAPQIHWNYYTSTEKGHFAFSRVPAGRVWVHRNIMSSWGGFIYSHGFPLELTPGKIAKVKVGGTGRPVTGRFTLPADAQVQTEWNHIQRNAVTLLHGLPGPEMPEEIRKGKPEERDAWSKAWAESPEGKAYINARRQYVMSISPDGSFRVEDIPSGKYRLDLTLRKPPENPQRESFGDMIASISHEFTVPEMPGSRSDEPLDLGVLELKLRETAKENK